MQHKTRHAPPRAAAMIEALRGLGYSTATALADIIDNSISAHADNINIDFFWEGEKSVITIIDNGIGMDEACLEKAMQLGCKHPLEQRSKTDLGRFGLGLKTASFSQGRSLTVASRKDGTAISCFRWDLDALQQSNNDEWPLIEGADEGGEKWLEQLDRMQQGTIVILQKLDRVVTGGFREQDFLDLIDVVERHISMVFHRYIEDEISCIEICINGRAIKAWNPFLTEHPATWSSPVVRSVPGVIALQCHVLPHKDKLDQREYEDAAGPDGWTAQQGFYVYRNNRLLLAGSWLGLGQGRSWTKEEAHRLARIRLDISNTTDSEWKIDIRKSTARPPVLIRARLMQFAEDTRARARRVFAHRGQPVHTGAGRQPLIQAWHAEHSSSGVRYRIDRSHPAVSSVIEAAGDMMPQISAMLHVIEQTIPVQLIWLDTAESREAPASSPSALPTEEIVLVLETLFFSLVQKRGLSATQARERLMRTEPFHDYPDLVAALTDAPEADGE